MKSAPAFYADSPTAALIAPWLTQHLPRLAPIVHHHLIQLTAGLMETMKVRVEQIATGSVFRATPVSNATHVHRILRDTRLSVPTVLDPLIHSVLATLQADTVCSCGDESHHTDQVRLLHVGIATDAMVLPVRFFLYDPADAWADDARRCLQAGAQGIPPYLRVIVLADRVHAGVPFLDWRESRGWMDLVRLSCATHVKIPNGWQTVDRMHPRRDPTRRLEQVPLWKRQPWTTNLVIHRHEPPGHRVVVW